MASLQAIKEPGDMEAEFAQIGVRRVVEKSLTYRDPAQFYFPKGPNKGKGFDDSHNALVVLPSWLSKEDVDYHASKFEQTGCTGEINNYRALDSQTYKVLYLISLCFPSSLQNLGTYSTLDLVYNIPGVREYIHDGGFKKEVPLLDEVVVMEGVGHFINQKRPEEISEHILDFFKF
ncbi:uncharacterized protein LOC130772153 [Actinidia eriantha]|uniref:uncharacterized protein LOC130772153 n=1 Tax=Actinidia eriantha TaxID=165200 RepID=UPI002587B2E8|nr:uncharacterized protein LOC130772153 [Actinidia eriantha]